MPTYPTPDLLTELAEARPDGGVVSLYLDTDPRKPENASDNPAWLVQLRNGLRTAGAQLEASGDRDAVLAWRDVPGRIEARVRGLSAAERGRALAFFTTPDGSWERIITSHLTLDEPHGAFDDRPWVAPLAKLVDRGRAIGVVLLDSDEMSMVRWADGRVDEPGVDSDLEAFRSENITGGEGGHDPRLRTHSEQLASRADEHQRRFLADAAARVARALPDLDVNSFVVVHAPGSYGHFADALPPDVADRIVGTVEAHLTGLDPAEVGDRFEEDLAEVSRRRGASVAAEALERAASGGAASVNAGQVLRALAQHRVGDLVLSPNVTLSADAVGEMADSFLAGVPETHLVERVIEQAITTGATVTVADSPELAEAGGVAAILRW